MIPLYKYHTKLPLSTCVDNYQVREIQSGLRRTLMLEGLGPRRPRTFLTIQNIGQFSHEPFYLPHHQVIIPHPCVAPFSYTRATCQNHMIYEAFATVSLWCLASHSYLFCGMLRFLARRRMRCCVPHYVTPHRH